MDPVCRFKVPAYGKVSPCSKIKARNVHRVEGEQRKKTAAVTHKVFPAKCEARLITSAVGMHMKTSASNQKFALIKFLLCFTGPLISVHAIYLGISPKYPCVYIFKVSLPTHIVTISAGFKVPRTLTYATESNQTEQVLEHTST